jgi:hypothetical protein
MPRYFFHFVWPDDAYRDSKGIEFDGLVPAYWHAIGWCGACVTTFLMQAMIG